MSPTRPYLVPTCRCGAQGARRRRQVFGAWRAVYQCEGCGKNLRATPVQPDEDLMALPLYSRRPRKQPNAKARAYKRWLSTREWREQSQRIQRRDRYRCRLRYEGCTRRSQTAHHVTYERFGGDERDSDLVAACDHCNQTERQRRIARRVLG